MTKNAISRFRVAFVRTVREAEGMLLFVAIASNLIAVPGTFGWFLCSAESWTVLNFLPRLVGYAGLSLIWWIFWPAYWIFG